MKSLIGSSIAVALLVGTSMYVPQTQESSKPQTNQEEKKPQEEKLSKEQKRKVDVWMKGKQAHAHEIFDGLIASDFKKIETASAKMIGNNFMERWLADRKPYEQYFAYHGQLNSFEYSTKELWRFAKQKDIDGALQAYGIMSRSCVRCHSLIRDGVVPPDALKDIAMNRGTITPAKSKNN